jgi:hypothetical protein
MILGLIPEESAGPLLADYMRRIDEELDDNLQDWLSGRWPALFRNKPASVLPPLRAMGEDQALSCYTRTEAMEALLTRAGQGGGPSLDAAVDWAAHLAAAANEDEMLYEPSRTLCATTCPGPKPLCVRASRLAATTPAPAAAAAAAAAEKKYQKCCLDKLPNEPHI